MDTNTGASAFARGNDYLAQKDFVRAIRHYMESLRETPVMQEEAIFSLRYAIKQLKRAPDQAMMSQAVWVSKGSEFAGIAEDLHRHLNTLASTDIWVDASGDLDTLFPKLTVTDLERLVSHVLSHPCALVVMLDASRDACVMAGLYQVIWGTRIVADVRLQPVLSNPAISAALLAGEGNVSLASCVDHWVSFNFYQHVQSAAEYLPLAPAPSVNESTQSRLLNYRQLALHGQSSMMREAQSLLFNNLLSILQTARSPESEVLQALQSDLLQTSQACSSDESAKKVAVLVHYYYEDIWLEIARYLDQITSPFDLFITTTSNVGAKVVADIAKRYPSARVFVSPNKGMDIVPFLNLIPLMVNEGYVAVLKLQTKKGDSHLATIWRDVMLKSLIGKTAQFDQVVAAFKHDPDLVCAGPATLFQSAPRIMYDNLANIQRLTEQVYGCAYPEGDWGFFAGTMFWARPESLLALSQIANFTNPELTDDYKVDGKLEHAIERFFGLVPVLTESKIGLLQPTATALDEVDLVCVAPGQAVGQADIGALMRQYERLQADYALVRSYELFNAQHYYVQCPELKASRTDLIVHYLLSGTYKGLSPDQAFSPSQYRALNQDVVKAYVEPYVHYLKSGAREKRALYKEPAALEANAAHLRYAVLNQQLISWPGLVSKEYDKDLVSIVIPVYSQPELTEDCIKSLIQCKNKRRCEVILVDNGSDAVTAEILQRYAQEYEWIHCVSNGENMNFALGCNLGFNAAKGGQVIFLNNDTTLTDGWVDQLVAPLSDASVVAVQPKLLFPDNTIQCAGVVFNAWSSLGYPLYAGFEPEGKEANTPRQLQAITAACIALRSRDFAKLKGFDPIFVNGQEDVDLCLRLTHGTGKHCYYQPESLVYHHEGKSQGRGKYVLRNRQVFLRRWESRIRADDLAIYAADGWQVQGWTLDLPEKTQQGLSIYRPVLGNQPVEPVFAEPFVDFTTQDEARQKGAKLDTAFSGQREVNPDAPSVLVCAHAAGVHLFGGERSFLDMLDALNAMQLNVVVSVPGVQNFDYLAAIQERACAVYCLHYPHWKESLVPDRRSINKFKSIIQHHRIEFVHCNTIMLREPMLAARELSVTTFMHIRELISQDTAIAKHIGLSTDAIIDKMYERTDYFIANSKTTAQDFTRGRNTFIAPNIVQVDTLDIANPIQPDRIVFGLISSNLPKKGIYEFAELAKRCAKSAPNARFAFVGPKSGPEWTKDIQALEAAVKRGELPNNIIFTGYKATPLDALQEVNVVVNLSLFAESFGRSVAEALAARRPVIVYDKGALAELVQEGVSGYVVPFKDLDAFEAKILLMCQQPERLAAMGDAGRRFIVEQYSPRTLMQRFNAAYLSGYCQRIDLRLARHSGGINAALLERAAGYRPFSLKTFVEPTTIIIPVYNAVKETESCIHSVLRHTDLDATQILIINDGSPDAAVRPMLEQFEGLPKVQIVHNEQNMGYTRTINKAIQLAGRDDVLLLNSDAFVTPGWFTGMRMAAASEDKVGTVTAMGNHSGAFSFPVQGVENLPPEGCSYDEFASTITLSNAALKPLSLPTGNGFCMLIKRSLLDEIGLFDEEAFPRGYGEENDFCMNGFKLGYSNLLSPWSYVFHVRSASFKGEKAQLLEAGALALEKKHPDYPDLVAAAFSSASMRALRQHIHQTVGTINSKWVGRKSVQQ